MEKTRPTLRCLLDDLRLALPSVDEPLDEIDHPVLRKAVEQFATTGATHERIRAIDDHVLFKVKVRRWRGAVWPDANRPWLVAAGTREAGSPDDFYAALAAGGRAARARYNRDNRAALTSDTFTDHLLPTTDDRLRYRLEMGARLIRRLESAIPELVRKSLIDGREHTAALDTFAIGVQVRADHGHETYVAICITGSVTANLSAVVLDIVPGCDPTGWYPERALPDRALRGNEQAWSNIMDTAAAAKLLDL
ncbi:hypothetical protein [Phytohabitans suffuscus]|uniref:hypothetical protein n=1 Tax=Phytohabitans suffuscus TaxID=624315 RepID=UPI001563A651|nr:hypothetical protein [Phytohabitans suffuscus]